MVLGGNRGLSHRRRFINLERLFLQDRFQKTSKKWTVNLHANMSLMNSNSKIFFVRHGKLSLPFKGHEEMPISVLSDLGNGKLNPPVDVEYTKSLAKDLLAKFPETLSSDIIYTSTIPRTEETAGIFQTEIERTTGFCPLIHKVSELDEVSFDLAKLFNGGSGIDAVNTAVFRGMISGKDAEFYEGTFNRVKRFFDQIAPTTGVKLIITHDFIMRVIEIFIRNNGQITKSIDLNSLEKTKRNTYVRGFATDSSFSKFIPIL